MGLKMFWVMLLLLRMCDQTLAFSSRQVDHFLKGKLEGLIWSIEISNSFRLTSKSNPLTDLAPTRDSFDE